MTRSLTRTSRGVRSIRKKLSKAGGTKSRARNRRLGLRLQDLTRSSRSRLSRSSSRSRLSVSSKFLGMPKWTAIGLGVAVCSGIVFALALSDEFSDMMEPMIHDVGEFFGLTEDTGIDTTNITHDRIYSGAISS
jgi:hypothetical protein